MIPIRFSLTGMIATSNAVVSRPTQPGYLAAHNVADVSYITPTTYGPPDILPSTPVTWTYSQGNHLPTAPSQTPPSNLWQQAAINDLVFPPPVPTRTESSTGAPYERERPFQPQTQVPTPVTQSARSTLSGVSYNWGLDVATNMQPYQNYPSPHSDVSGPTTISSVPVSSSVMLSPSKQIMASPTVAGSPESPLSSRQSSEPTRNAQGMLYCSYPDPDCQRNPPVFNRLCEWT